MIPEDCKKLETATRRKISDKVLHPNYCSKLTICKTEWAIPPKSPPGGILLRPDFSGDTVGFQADSAGDDWPDHPEAAEWLDMAPEPSYETCEACGSTLGSEIELELEKQSALVGKTFELAAILLRRQYDLTDAQLQEILTVSDSEFMGLFTDLYIWQSK